MKYMKAFFLVELTRSHRAKGTQNIDDSTCTTLIFDQSILPHEKKQKQHTGVE